MNIFNQHVWCYVHYSCLPSWEARVEILVRPPLKILKYSTRKAACALTSVNG